MKNDRIVLQVQDFKKEFSFTHAEKILGMGKNGGWKLPDDSPYQFDKKNGLKLRGNKENSGKQSKKSDSK